VVIYAGVKGYLDRIAVGDIGRFEKQLLADMKSRTPEIFTAITTDKQLTPQTEEKLKATLEAFSKSFS
jgi:F-type H+-transporting ATPase subunit alpha